ncbi:Piso0_005619 [Millerozyma farinosa CBS 7064]|uniref:Piso0_005619 protein n=1 Tax=Pichia sorbitophila (strain ATCC MYA-4447 / BCRC 22081 / CBS 7064 / NBRC 10061 / NRRL Y-12695) TaxID=559304 RepID=G8XZH3_PICSO|nr:Piso0_005619 [Millerozyma farinosa CBS 7064]
MPTQIDELLSFVNKLNERTGSLCSTLDESYTMMEHITSRGKETAVHNMTEQILCNHEYLMGLQGLNQKLYLVESSLHLNDLFTTSTSLDNLAREHEFLKNKSKRKEPLSCVSHVQSPLNESIDHSIDDEVEYPKTLNNALSLSNLKLRPIRCSSKKSYKKRSKLRLSTIYKFNPLLDEQDEHANGGAEDTASSISFDTVKHYDRAKDSGPSPLRCVDTSSHNYSELTEMFSRPDQKGNTDISYSQDSFSPFFPVYNNRKRSYTVPKTPNDKRQHRDYILPQTPYMSTGPSDEGVQPNQSLKHFISFRQPVPYNTLDNETPLNKEHHKNDSPSRIDFVPLSINDEIDNISVSSNLSVSSKESNQDDISFTDFSRFLRRSRLDLPNSFPHILKRANSHDSVLTKRNIQTDQKFHNPIERIKTTSVQLATPTVEKICSDRITSGQSSKFNTDSVKWINQVISKTNVKENMHDKNINENSHSKPRLSIFNFHPNSSPVNIEPERRRVSVDIISQSISEGFKNLMSSKDKKNMNSHPTNPNIIGGEPDNSVLNTPKRKNNGAHSRLIVGPNKTKIISYGNIPSSHQPIVSDLNHKSLQEALSMSLM